MQADGIEEALRAWRQAHPAASWDEIETEVQRHLAGLQAEWMGLVALPAEAAAAAAAVPSCPGCGEGMRPCGQRSRTLLTRMGRPVTLERAYWVCPACGAGLFPPG
jgi:hypothetical protein